MRFPSKWMIVLAALLAAMPAWAQVCKEPGSSTSSSSSGGQEGTAKVNREGCDTIYRDKIITGDFDGKDSKVRGTLSPYPAKPMPMIDTPKKSYISDYSPYLFTFPRDPDNNARPYSGTYSIGTKGDALRVFQMFGPPAKNVKPWAACRTMLSMGDIDPTDVKTQAKVNRIQADNCANEYILNWAIGPFQDQISTSLLGEDDDNPGKLVDVDSQCQPLKSTVAISDNEYLPSDYMKAAWKKTLVDPNYRKTIGGAARNIPCTDNPNIPCDREPHLPSGAKLSWLTEGNKPLNPPDPFPEVTISNLWAVPFEKINDPTHPFSPRWDFVLNDRQYGDKDASAVWAVSPDSAGVATSYAALSTYQEEPKNSVFCAGTRPKSGGASGGSEEKKDEGQVLVDVLEFRRKTFENALFRRTGYNWACFKHRDFFGGAEMPLPLVMFASFCYKITRVDPWPPYTVWAQGYDCWGGCFGLKEGTKLKPNESPPCTTNHLGEDLNIKGRYQPGFLNMFSRQARCALPGELRNSKYEMKKVCADLRKPVTMINRLQMRYYNPDEKDNNSLTEGVLEGMFFKDYFGDHMPYPRMWDTGSSLQKTPAKDINAQPEKDKTGQYTAIVGVGRDAIPKAAEPKQNANGAGGSGSEEDKPKPRDERCKTMGWGSGDGPIAAAAALPVVKVAGAIINVPDGMTSWTEMKLYQARASRSQQHVNCIARYEKVFKPWSAEAMILSITGADWPMTYVYKCKAEKADDTDACTEMSLREYVKHLKESKEAAGGGGNGGGEQKDEYVYRLQSSNKALAGQWRGYMASSIEDKKHRFPDFGKSGGGGGGGALGGVLGGGGSATVKGLDNAQPGDIILMPNGPGNSTTKPGLAKVAFVTEAVTPKRNKDCEEKKNCYVRVFEPDNGKFPDICGSTDTLGVMVARNYYKPGSLPAAAKEEYEKRVKTTASCEETGISHCELNAWDKLTLYRINEDRRDPCDKISAKDCDPAKKENGK